MSHPCHKPAAATALAVVLATTSKMCAAAGFAIIEQSASGMGNAFAGAGAVAEDASTIFFNPAGMTKLKGRHQIVGALHAIAPNASFSDSGSLSRDFGPPTGSVPLFGSDGLNGGTTGIVPNLYYAGRIGDSLSIGLGINAPFGLKTEYPEKWKGRYHAVTSDLRTIDINPAIAWQVNDMLSVGAGVSARYTDVELSNALDMGTVCFGLEATGSLPAGTCTAAGAMPMASDGFQVLTGDDWGFGFNLGVLIEPRPGSRIGLAYRSNVKHTLKGDVDFTVPANLQPVLGGVFADSGASADLDLPETLSVSGYHEVNDKLALLADVTWTRWSRFDELRVRFDGGLADSAQPADWKNVFRYSLGLNYRAHPEWMFRGGLAYDEEPIRNAELRTPRIPGNDRKWVSLGLSHTPNDRLRLDLGYSHLFVDRTPIDNTEGTTGHTLTGTYRNSVDIFSAQVVWTIQ